MTTQREETVSTRSIQDEAKHRLRHLGNYMPDADEALKVFGEYLADGLERHGAFSPSHFILSYNTAVDQLRIGGSLKGRTFSGPDCDHLFVSIAFVATAIFPEEFAAQILARVGNRTS